MKRCSDPKCELVFLQLAGLLRKLLKIMCFGGEVKDYFVNPGKLKNASNNASLLSNSYRHDLNVVTQV